MPQPTLGDVHINRPLTLMSVGYVQDMNDFVANQAFPSVPVPNKSDLYFVYNRGDFFRNNMQKRAPGTPAVAGGYKLATQTYVADVWAEKKIIDDQIRANSDAPLQPDRDATYWLTQQALVNRDVNWAGSYFSAGIWGNTDQAGIPTGTPTANQFLQWSATGSTPVENILAGQLTIKQNTGYWPNTLVLGAQVYIALLTNAEVIDRLKYGQTAPGPVVVSTTDLEALFKVKRVLIMSGIQTSSPESLTNSSDQAPIDAFSFISGKNALLCYASDSPGIFQPSGGYSFNWTGLTGATAAGMRIKKYRWEVDSADHVEIESAYAFGLVAPAMGVMFLSAVA
jgi:hypothetical protein